MAKRITGYSKRKKSNRSPKTKKRLAVKKLMLEAKALKKKRVKKTK